MSPAGVQWAEDSRTCCGKGAGSHSLTQAKPAVLSWARLQEADISVVSEGVLLPTRHTQNIRQNHGFVADQIRASKAVRQVLRNGSCEGVYAWHEPGPGKPSKNEASLFAMCAGADAADSSLAKAACCGVLTDVCGSLGLVDLCPVDSGVLGP